MFGAIAGDVIGSVYEWMPIKSKDFPLFSAATRFTDDTVLTVAVADCLLDHKQFVETFHQYVERYPDAGYGASFDEWATQRRTEPYNSWGNGSAMRVSPVGWAFDTVSDVLDQARASASVTHNHPEGVKGAQAVALAVFLARQGESKATIRAQISQRCGYDLSTPVAALRETHSFDVSCQGSVPQALTSFLESEDYEDAIRNAISLGGDADTLACIAGAVAEAFYGSVPAEIRNQVWALLDADLGSVIEDFQKRFQTAEV